MATITRTTTRSRRSRSYEETNRDNLARALGEESLPAIGGLARRSGNYAFPFSKSLCACAPTYPLLLRRRPIHLVVLPYAVNTSPRRSTALHPNTLIPPGDAASTVSNSLIRNQHATKRRSPDCTATSHSLLLAPAYTPLPSRRTPTIKRPRPHAQTRKPFTAGEPGHGINCSRPIDGTRYTRIRRRWIQTKPPRKTAVHLRPNAPPDDTPHTSAH